MEYNIDFSRGIISRGNLCRLKQLIKRAENGGNFTIGFIGGSITQGSLSSKPATCYAYLVYKWWVNKFPKAKFTYLNAGIGATTSQFGAARAKTDLLKYNPDFVLVEFSVNDGNNSFFLETYEGLIRQIYSCKSEPAVLIFNNMRYDNGESAQQQHIKIGEHYHIPCVGIKPVYDMIKAGEIQESDISPDGLHPNDTGHKLIAEDAKYFLNIVFNERNIKEDMQSFKSPLTKNRYEHAVRYQNYNAVPELDGFKPDYTKQENITQVFKNGWTADKEGASITFEVEGTEAAVQYRKSVKKPAPVAAAIIDGDTEHAVMLDANFEEDWGDCLYTTTLVKHGALKKRRIEIKISKVQENNAAPFYLTSVISSL